MSDASPLPAARAGPAKPRPRERSWSSGACRDVRWCLGRSGSPEVRAGSIWAPDVGIGSAGIGSGGIGRARPGTFQGFDLYCGALFLTAGEQRAFAMSKTLVKPRTKVKTKTQRPPLYKVILLNDVFRMNADQARRVMMTAHTKGVCVIAVYTRDVAETKAKEATELGKSK